MMKIYFVLMFVIVSSGVATAVAQPYSIEWQTQFGTPVTEDGFGVANDPLGNVFITGSTAGTLPGAIRVGQWDAFLKKYSPSGVELWTRELGTTSVDFSQAVAVDGVGNAYISGYTTGDLGGPNAGGSDAFLTKVDAAGNVLWSKQVGLRGDDSSISVALDPFGNVIVGGYSEDDVFGVLPNTRASFVAKFDNAGNLLWNKKYGVPEFNDSNAVRADSVGNVYVAGRTVGGAFLKKLDSQGDTLWTKNFGVNGNDWANGLAIDASDNVYVSGLTGGAIGGPTAGSVDAYLMKLDGAGNELWTRLFGAIGPDYSAAVAVDAAGNPFMTGIINEDPNGFTINANVFVAKYNAGGDQLWTATRGSTAVDQARSLSIDNNGNVYVAGYTEGNLTGVNYLSGDAFLIKFAPVPEPGSLVLLAGACCLFTTRRRISPSRSK